MSLPQFWLKQNRKDLAERAMVAKRDQMARHSQQCEITAKYHRELNLLSSQYRNIENNQCNRIPKVNQESRKEEELRARRKEKLEIRRHKLKSLLDKEHSQLLEEYKEWLTVQNEKDPWNVSRLKQQIEELKKKRMEEEELMKKSAPFQQLYSSKLPYLKEHDASKYHEKTLAEMEERKRELQMKAMERQSREMQRKEELEQKLKEAQQNLEKALAEKIPVEKSLKQLLSKKIAEMEQMRMDNEEHKLDFKILNDYDEAINHVTRQRKDVLRVQEERIERIQFFRPSKERIRKMCNEVTHRLNLDLTSLNFLCKMIEEGSHSRVKICLDDVIAGKQAILDKLAKENSRMSNLQILFEEEASKLWRDWKETWEELLKQHEDMMTKAVQSLRQELEKRKLECVSYQENYVSTQKSLLTELEEEQNKAQSVVREMEEKVETLKNEVKELEERLKQSQSHMPCVLAQM